MTASVGDFSTDGFLAVRGAVRPDIVRACVEVIEAEQRSRVSILAIPQRGLRGFASGGWGSDCTR
jgi:hypothetical protein